VKTRPIQKDSSTYLPDSGEINLNNIGIEAGQVDMSQTSMNDADVRDLIGKASGTQMAMSEWYGASAGPPSLISIPSDEAVYSEWSLSGGGNDGGGVGMGTWSFGAKAGVRDTCTASTLSGKTLVGNFKSYQCTYDVSFTAGDRGGNLRIAFKSYANTLVTGHNQAGIKQVRLFEYSSPPPLASSTGRFKDSFVFQDDYSSPHQFGLQIVAYAGSDNTCSVIVHSLDITDLARKKTELRIGEAK
jgi:hypothetical protein